MKHLYRVVRCPKGTAPGYLPWHHLWLALGLTALGLLLGWLTMPLAAVSSPDLSAQDLWAWYLSSGDLWYRNLLPPVLLIWLMYFLTGRCWLSYLLTALPALGVALANYFKIQLRGDPLLASDLKLISEAGGIVGNYSLDMTPLIQQTLGWAALGLVLALLLLPRGLRRRDIRIFGLLSAAAVMGTAFLTLYCNEASYRRTTAGSELVNPWSDTEVFVSHGVLYPFLYSVQDMLPVPPEGYQEAVASSALERYPEEAIPEDQKVSVVGIMLEAFCDLTDFPALAEQEGVQEVYAPWHALEEESVSGDLLTNIFAGGTVDTEWCFLTGYSQYEEFRNDVDSYVWYFDWQGYQTRGGHPGFGWFYNRQNVNQFLGFQEYWFTENHYGELVDPVEAQWNSDLLLVDDIQFIAGKESTQEEFFHPFNSLHDAHKQIVIASDRPAKEIKSLEERLRTRFEWGLTADIQPPDFETRVAIVKRKAELLHLDLPEDVAEFIANHLKNNIRQLEGAVKKLNAYYMLEGIQPVISVAQNAIKDILNETQPVPVTIEKIVGEVSRTFNVSPADIRGTKRNANPPCGHLHPA